MQIKNSPAPNRTEIITNEIPKYDPKVPIEWDQRFPVVLSDAETDGESDKVNYFDFFIHYNSLMATFLCSNNS
jgi:hypothetical protein